MTTQDQDLDKTENGQQQEPVLAHPNPLAESLEALGRVGFSVGPIGSTLALRYGDTMLCAPSVVELITLWASVREEDARIEAMFSFDDR